MSIKQNSFIANAIAFFLLTATSLISYTLCQATKFTYLYLTLPLFVVIDRKVRLPLLTIVAISLFDEQMLNFPIGFLVSINTLLVLLYRVLSHKLRLSYL